MKYSPLIQILLATYNGSKYLDQFIISLVSQTYSKWELIVRDDGSSDSTLDILIKWQSKLNANIHILNNSNQSNLGVIGNFSCLLNASTASYIMFADQDDIWKPNKIELTLDAMLLVESNFSINKPCLVHTDLTLVDDQLNLISSSFWNYQGLNPMHGNTLPSLLVENMVWGCTSMINRALLELVGDIPVKTIHFDWWFALVAAAFGKIVSLPIQSILWRRHESNQSDISSLMLATQRMIMSPSAMKRKLNTLLDENRLRAETFVERYQSKLDINQLESILAFIEIPNKCWFERRYLVIKHKLLFSSYVRNIGLLLLL